METGTRKQANLLWLGTVVLLVVPLSSCAHRHASSPGISTAVQEESAVLEVENNTTLDVRIFLVRGSMTARLGTVSGMSSGTFELRPAMLKAEVRFYASPIGGWQRIVTDPVLVRPGQTVSLHLDNLMRSYRLSVW